MKFKTYKSVVKAVINTSTKAEELSLAAVVKAGKRIKGGKLVLVPSKAAYLSNLKQVGTLVASEAGPSYTFFDEDTFNVLCEVENKYSTQAVDAALRAVGDCVADLPATLWSTACDALAAGHKVLPMTESFTGDKNPANSYLMICK